MKPAFRPPGEADTFRGQALLEVLDELCERHAALQVATPYLSFPAHAVDRQGKELRLRITLTEDFVKRTLATQPLRIRFPWGLGLAGGPVRILGYAQAEGKRFVRLGLPPELVDEDRRAAVRLEPPAGGTATLNADGVSLVRARLEDLSVLGARVFALEPLNEAFVDNHLVQFSLSLEHGPHLEAQARLVHQDGQSLGLAFQPPLAEADRLGLEAFLRPVLDEACKRWENRAALRAAAAARARPKAPPEGLLLLSRERGLEAELVQALPESLPLRLCPPALAPLREALERPPKLVLLHLAKANVEERFLVKSLLEALPAGTPTVVVAAPGLAGARAFSVELKASAFVEWNPAQALFLTRLLQGLARRRWGQEEGVHGS